MEIKFCSNCGGNMKQGIPHGDDHMRAICTQCGFIHYLNPKVVVGCIPQWGDKILMCKRNIEPGKGKWTLPAGYLENGETMEAGAARETLEETRGMVNITGPCRLFNIPHVNQIYMMFRAELTSREFGPTPESTHVQLFQKEEIPWDNIAFSVIHKTLKDFFSEKHRGSHSFEIKTMEAPLPHG
ncbi:ADP-ribose pyrophosphatase YjhB, NUDIX family [Desulfocicer vacuolatum DSM 3385]|uniref:ADP-ribose pyrophosphatase YjhB, NUDIX family n=1 Tax=Desulfocicer vacuolatum DSM 3385 TaxID=1121400 RepID=A0A1W1YNQ0_9BACT|nr:NUDIX hydrolase [Desulfocicer vacuolatum]SMC37840.1 ADP-ribose pyrophosphatase YjhB, NUDIX family [Desulfocicer vacuolatum DSM 3385]